MDDLTRIIIPRILQREGGYVNRAEDRGGPTNFGITIKAWAEYLAATAPDGKFPAVDADTIKQLTVVAAQTFYEWFLKDFAWIADKRLADIVCDAAVNNGRDRAARWLQRAAGVLEDGILGPVTQAAINAPADPVAWMSGIYGRFFVIRMKAYAALVSANHSQAIFCAGWFNRLAEFVRF